MAFLIFDHADYKLILKEKIKDLKKTKSKFSLKYLANSLDIQYTFLSKVLNSDSHHLSEDQVFKAGHSLEFIDDEIEYLLLLRSHQATQSKNRKNYLFQKISTIQKRHGLSLNTAEPTSNQMAHDMRYLMDYQALVIHAALSIKSIQKNPFVLASHMGLDLSRLKEILVLLDQMGRIEYDSKTNEIKKLIHTRMHFGKDHPLTRMHQLIMKTALNQLSFNKSETKKENFFITFTTDPEGFEKIKKQLNNSLTKYRR